MNASQCQASLSFDESRTISMFRFSFLSLSLSLSSPTIEPSSSLIGNRSVAIAFSKPSLVRGLFAQLEHRFGPDVSVSWIRGLADMDREAEPRDEAQATKEKSTDKHEDKPSITFIEMETLREGLMQVDAMHDLSTPNLHSTQLGSAWGFWLCSAIRPGRDSPRHHPRRVAARAPRPCCVSAHRCRRAPHGHDVGGVHDAAAQRHTGVCVCVCVCMCMCGRG